MEPGSQAENGRGVPRTDGRTGWRTDRQTACRKKWRANKTKHRNQDQIKTNAGFLESQGEEKEHRKPLPAHVTPSCVPKKAKVQKEAMELSQKVRWVDLRGVLCHEHFLPEDLAALAFLWTWG